MDRGSCMPLRKIILPFLILGAFLGAPSLALAGTRGCLVAEHPGIETLDEKKARKWWRWDLCKAEVGITDEQSDKLEAIFQSFVPDLHRQKGELDRRETHLSTLLVEGSKEEKVREAIDRVEDARSDLGRSWALMLYRMYKVLSPDQRRKLKAFSERHNQERQPSQEQAGVRREL
ncbi:MAG: periplasmic heavy metal sensor [Luteitalea sp.]|nr:periplasmic heavy metal sensor [Luteitalea sp.]